MDRQLYSVYLGDSILRGAFIQFAIEVGADSVPGTEMLNASFSWYHNPQFFCCNSSVGGTPNCIWGRQGIEFEGSAHQVGAHHLASGAILCAIFVWAPLEPAVELQAIAKDVQSNVGRNPDMVVLNVGLHQFLRGTEDDVQFVGQVLRDVTHIGAEMHHTGNETGNAFDTVSIIFQEVTSLIDHLVWVKYADAKERFNQRRVETYNKILRAGVASIICDSKEPVSSHQPALALVKAHSLSAEIPHDQRTPDGIHFGGGFSRHLNHLYYNHLLRQPRRESL